MPTRKPEPRLRGEPPTTRRRESRRKLLGRERREAYGREVGLDPDRNAAVHARLVESESRHLELVRRRWADRITSAQALDTLRASLPDAVSGRVRERTRDMIEQLAQWLADTSVPTWIRSPEDLWLVDAQHELDDDEIAKILSPQRLLADREAALRNVREKRSKIVRRR